ncbi:MAG: hypothetical protein RL701_2011 [Pseudomonadota bacterium]|jgi:hypothetical protein
MTSLIWVAQPTATPSPGEAAAYLRAHGWSLAETNRSWTEYSRELANETVILEVPQLSTARDYARAVETLVADIARLEKRAPVEVLRDIKAASTDIVRIGVHGALTRDGRIPVEAGLRVYEAARDMLLSAACAVLDPKPVFATRKPDEAMKLLDTARFGQNEVGSFVLTIECNIAPRLNAGAADQEDYEGDIPFERRTCMTLAHALNSTSSALRECAASGGLEPFRLRTKDGVSANMCEALAALITASDAERVRAAFSFAAWRPLHRPTIPHVDFGPDAAPILQEAAKQLRHETPLPAFEVIGAVTKLTSDNATSGGEIVVQLILDKKPRAVRISLDANAYLLAVRAHQSSAFIRCTGDLTRDKRALVLRNPTSVELLEATNDE